MPSPGEFEAPVTDDIEAVLRLLGVVDPDRENVMDDQPRPTDPSVSRPEVSLL
jgi:hypothetical protein